MKRTLQCCALNGGVFWLSILLFEYGLMPAVQYLLTIMFGDSSSMGMSVWGLIQTFLNLTFSVLWVVPLFFLSKIVNSLWFQVIYYKMYSFSLYRVVIFYLNNSVFFQDIADSAYRYSRGRPQLFSSFGKLIADGLFSILVQFLFLLQVSINNIILLVLVGL